MLDFFSMLTGGGMPRYPWEMDPTAGGIPYMDAYDAGGGGDQPATAPLQHRNYRSHPPTPERVSLGDHYAQALDAGFEGTLEDFARMRQADMAQPPAAPPPAAAAPAGPVPRSLSPDLYRPLDLRSTMPEPGAAPMPPGTTAAPPGSGRVVTDPSQTAPPAPNDPRLPALRAAGAPPGLPGPAVPGVLQQPRQGGIFGGLFGGMLGGGGMTGPDGKELTTEQMMDRVLRMQLQKAMMPDWGKMAAAFAEAGKPSLLPTGGMGAAIGKAAGAMSGGGGTDALHMMEIMQKVADAKEKSASRKELGASLKTLNDYLAKRGSGMRVNTTTGAIIPPSPPAAGSSGGGIPNMTAADAGGGGDDGGGSGPLDLIAKYESGGRNIEQGVVGPQGGYNPSVGRVTGPSSASGPWQMIDSTYRDAASRTAPVEVDGVTYNPSDYRRAIQAPVPVQRAVAQTLFNEQGYKPWAPYNSNLRKALARGGGTQLASAGGGIPNMTAADAGGGGDDGGGYQHDDALALLLAQIGAQAQLGGFGDIAKPYETYLYNQPGYIREKQRAQTGGEWDVREPIEQRARREQSELDTKREAARLKIELENKKAEQENASRYEPMSQPQWIQGPNGPEFRPMTKYEFAQRQQFQPGQPAPAGPPPMAPPMAAPGPLPGAPNLRAGGALPMAAPAPQGVPAAPGSAAAAPNAPPVGRVLPQPVGELAKDHKWDLTPQGWVQVPIPGTPAYKAQTERDASEITVANRGIQTIDRALGMSSPWSTGFWGARLSGIEGGQAYGLAAELVQLKAMTSFEELQKMRAASPTGGALGAVSDTEGTKLESVRTSLNQFVDKPQFDASLMRLKQEYLDVVYGSKEKIDRAVKEGKLPQRVADQVEALKAQALGGGPGGPGPGPGGAPQAGGAPQSPPTERFTVDLTTTYGPPPANVSEGKPFFNGKTWIMRQGNRWVGAQP